MSDLQYRKALSLFTTGVVVVAAKNNDLSKGKEFFGLTINSFSSISLKPPLVLFCLGNESSTFELFKNNDYFSLNILSKDQIELSKAFAKANNPQKWEVEEFNLGKNNSPIFKNSLAFLECKKEQMIPAGDHHIIIGEVKDFAVLNSKKEPLIYYASNYLD